MTELEKIIVKYTTGKTTLEETNKALKDAKTNLQLDPEKNKIHKGEEKTFGLMGSGTGTLDKVAIKNGKLVDGVGDMKVEIFFDGKKYNAAKDGATLVPVV